MNNESSSHSNTPSSAPLSVIVLAAGKGTRMKSPLPKVLHPVVGQPMVGRVLNAAKAVGAKELRVVVGYGESLVRRVIEPMGAVAFPQTEQKGTAHAVMAAQPESLNGTVLILNGDNPLLEASDLEKILAEFNDARADLAVVTAEMKSPGSLGRIVRQKGELRAIVEASDAGPETLRIREVNSGAYVVKASVLASLLPQVKPNNAKGEFYLTDIIALALEAKGKDRLKVMAIKARPAVAFGVNTQEELAKASNVVFKRNSRRLMENGVVMIDPRTVYAEDDVLIGSGTVVYPGVYLRGATRVGSYCVLEPGVHIISSSIADSTHVKAGCYFENAVVGEKVQIGPYARLRPESQIGREAQIGNFVELKKTTFGARSKAGHLTYLGDAIIGEDVNVGCGTITCNYAADRKKYQTVVENGVFVGSDVQFVAPVKIGEGAVIASGSTITEDVPAKSLAIARGRQVNKTEWTPKKK
ncbi:MAG: bifunctional UDP-N-acetylglucosamine diphosphorylase/glucosamine-1-phosphate N-acetyltransferase GlmU [Bdellovibrionales bacterium]|jgi:bifunctional UDP-N-acetylglucosamine pyrophosphorylase/glucosamine-1-phosphate N-acetyltransferase|nr:bifunctional UDP-N-acetylglucosamine diphosphorylase/glucosamine-1-phosphate N-acetyltransferase GlmU [Bdellovibrionales bacterium]